MIRHGPLAALQRYLPPLLQVGGDETTGKGLCSTRLSAPEK